jgi:type I restriction enzyme, S subunit
MNSVMIKTSLPEICELVTDGTHDSPKLQFSGVPFIKGKHISAGRVDFENCDFITEADHQKCIKRVRPQPDDVLFSNIGSVGDAARVTDEIDFSIKNVALFRPDQQKIDPLYFYYLVISPYFRGHFLNVRSGSAQPFISLENFRSLKFNCLKSKSAQQKVGAIIAAYDDLIENNRRRIKLLEQAARLLYKEWFVHLRFPGHEHVKIVNGIPEGWGKKKIADVCETVGGGTPSTSVAEYWDGDITWVVPSDITKNDCLVLLNSDRKITEKGLRESSAKMVPPETILMTSRASVGFFTLLDYAVCTNQGFINIIPHDENMRLYMLFNLMSRVEEIRSNAKGTTYPEISKSRFRDMDIVVPADAIVYEFSSFTSNIIHKLRTLKRAVLKLTQARDLLLPRLMNGEIAV